MTVTSKHRSCPLVPANGISRSAGQLKITNLYSKLRGKICFKYSRFEEKDSNIRILFGLQNSRIRIRIFKIRGKRFESEYIRSPLIPRQDLPLHWPLASVSQSQYCQLKTSRSLQLQTGLYFEMMHAIFALLGYF